MTISDFNHGLDDDNRLEEDILLSSVAELRLEENLGAVLDSEEAFGPWNQW